MDSFEELIIIGGICVAVGLAFLIGWEIGGYMIERVYDFEDSVVVSDYYVIDGYLYRDDPLTERCVLVAPQYQLLKQTR